MVNAQTIQTFVFVLVALAIAWLVALVSAQAAGSGTAPSIGAEPKTTSPVTTAILLDDTVASIGGALTAVVINTVPATTTTADPRPQTLLTSAAPSPDLIDRLAGRTVHAVGDSLLLSATDELRLLLGESVTIDTESGLGLYYAGPKIRSAALDPDIVVIALGTNDHNEPEAFISSLEDTLDQLAAASCVIWVDTLAFAPGLEAINSGILNSSEKGGTFVAGWSELGGTPELHASDGYHLSFEGQDLFASLIAASIETACI